MDGKKKILYLQSTSEIGGSDVSLSRILEHLDKSKFTAHVALPYESPLIPQLEKQGAVIHLVPEMLKMTSRKGFFYILRYLFNYPKAIGRLCRIIRENEIDIVHTNTLHNLYGFLAAKRCGAAHVWHVREIVKQSRGIGWFEKQLAMHFGGRIVVTSDAVAAMFGDPRLLPKQVRKIPNAIDTQQFHPNNTGCLHKDYALAPQTPLVGIVGRLDHWKGVEVFIRAAAECRKQFPLARFFVIGGPVIGREAFAEDLKTLAKQLGADKEIIFTGWRYAPADMPAVHASLSVLVLASTWPEPFGLVLLEAMASGKPVIATRHGGPVEICAENKSAFLVTPKDSGALTKALETLLSDPQKAKQMGEEGRKRVEERFDVRKTILELEKIYGEIAP